MARDGLLPAIAAKVHPRFGTPMLMTAFTGMVGMIVAGMCPIYVIGELVSFIKLLSVKALDFFIFRMQSISQMM